MNRRNGRKEVILDLTSLLDVIFIVLLIVMSRQQLLADKTVLTEEELNSKISEQEAMTESANAAYEMYTEQLETFENINNYAPNVVIYSDYMLYDPTERIIRVKFGDADITEIGYLYSLNTDSTFKLLADELREFVALNEDKPILVSLNAGETGILYRDEVAILAIINDLRADFPNIYVK